MPQALNINIRKAEKADLEALSTLVLTSFSQFSLFAYLYSPLQRDINVASETLWYWRRRLRLGMLDPASHVIVAEATIDSEEDIPTADEDGDEGGQSRRLLDWAMQKTRERDPQFQLQTVDIGDRQTKTYIVGFAIWNVRDPPDGSPKAATGRPPQSWLEWLEAKYIQTEWKFWKTISPRKDQDPEAFPLYLESEEKLEAMCYSTETVYYLDNVTVDFRFQRRGIGKELIGHGLAEATRLGLKAMTEAGEKGEGLYYKLGFEKVADWEVCDMKFPVMRWTPE
ncbi:hypothetical protein B0H63DRAFT_521390 [Podospora didyma]|uniref:N-acetyltransferase domain-containing protein n=1 Tax=Podospora didyma TaxID=330526 RepID=A0AAE0NTC4_9PEZI|nr:hypothetical protein B0H63DRAFT_521390 [Podospora didyma]